MSQLQSIKRSNGERLLTLLRCTLRQTEVQPCAPEELEDLLKLAARHEIQPIVAYGLILSGGLGKEQETRCRKILYMAVMRQEQLDRELKKICGFLEDAGIDYMPLKGAVMRKLYPEPWMRTSCDIDILVRDVDQAAMLLEEHGYQNKGRGSHDVILISPAGITVELHFQLIETDDRVNALLERVWDHAHPRQGTRHYEMEPEMFYFYHIAHMAKHMRFGGCGIRSFVDIWIFQSLVPMAEEKKNHLLKAAGMEVFAEQSERLCRVWFEGRMPDLLLKELERFILNSGALGSKSNAVTLNRIKGETSAGFVLLRIFMPYSSMVLKYPELKKYPVLLPVFWIRRWLELLMKNKKIENAVQEIAMNKKLDKQSIAETKRLFRELELF